MIRVWLGSGMNLAELRKAVSIVVVIGRENRMAVHCSIVGCFRPQMTPMSSILELNCWVLGDDPRRVFPLKIVCSETVGYLKKVIKDEKKPVFDDITADSLDLWKVSTGYWCLSLTHSS